GAGTGTPPRGRGGLRQPQAPPLSARGGVDRACRCQRPALAAVQFGLRPDRRVVVEVQRGTSSGRGAGARGPVQCCWRDPGPCNAPGYPRLVQPQWTVRNSCVNRASLTVLLKRIGRVVRYSIGIKFLGRREGKGQAHRWSGSRHSRWAGDGGGESWFLDKRLVCRTLALGTWMWTLSLRRHGGQDVNQGGCGCNRTLA